MKSNDLNYEQAEAFKIEKGIHATSTSSSTNTEEHDPLAIKIAENTIYSNLVEELRKTLKYYIITSLYLDIPARRNIFRTVKV